MLLNGCPVWSDNIRMHCRERHRSVQIVVVERKGFFKAPTHKDIPTNEILREMFEFHVRMHIAEGFKPVAVLVRGVGERAYGVVRRRKGIFGFLFDHTPCVDNFANVAFNHTVQQRSTG